MRLSNYANFTYAVQKEQVATEAKWDLRNKTKEKMMKLKELTNAPRNGNFRYHVRAAAEMLLDDLEGEAWEATHAILCLGLSASVSKYDQAIDNAVDKIIACGMDEKIVSF